MNKIKSISLFSMIGATLIFSVLASVFVGVVNAEDSAQQAYIVLEENCFQCHGNLGDFKETLFIEAYNSLIQSGSVAPGQPGKSELYKRLLGPTENGAQMPPNRPPLTDKAIESIRIWIENGAPDWNVVDGNRSFITNRRILETIQHHIETLPIPNRAFARYFSTTHLYNAGLPTEPLQSHALALSKLINSLSWGADIVNPEPINAEQTLFYIDLRNYEWDINDAWTHIEKHYPYNIKYEGADQTDLRDLFIDLQSEMDCEVPFVNMDWFIGKASEPPLYNEILALPDTDTALETLLGVDVIDNLKNHLGVRVWRAGIKDSGVSRHNRVVERHKARYGAYWKSYDFAGSDGKQNISDFPLSFIHDGGEVVFNLPNGLQAYHLFDAKGMRLDSAPTEIVSNQDASDPAVYNGISCIDCHTDGMKPFTDVIRPVIEAAQNPIYDKDYALQLYVEQAVMDSLVQDDTEHFLTALTKTGNSSEGSEPISRFHGIYNHNALDAAHAAAAVGLPKNVFLSKIRERADLGVFLVEGDVVKRDTWTSIFDAVVHALNPSIPDVDPPETGDIISSPDDAVYIPDPNLRAALARMLQQRVDEPITVSQMEQFSNISHSGHIRNGVDVKGLTLEDKGIRDLTGLEFAINLKRLSLKWNKISNLTPLSRLTKLEYLDIGGNNVSDLSPITNLTNIEQLNLGDTNPISDLSPIANLHNIKFISIGEAALLTDFSVLADMENLIVIGMWGPRFRDMSPLVNLPNIETIDLCGNEISEIPSLKNAPKLKELYVFGNNVSDVSILQDLTNLERLNLRNNNITDIAPLAGLTNLKWLDLTGNPIRDWTPLYELSKNTKIEPNGFAFSADSTLVALDSTFTFNIDALFVQNLTGWQCGISFDPNLLEAIEVIEGDFLSSDATQTFFREGSIDNENGLITGFSVLRIDGTGLNGSGPLLSIKFKAKKVGKVTFTPGDCTLGDSAGVELPSVVPNLEIEIVEELPTPEADIFTGPKWDVNMDGKINILDLIVVTKHFGKPIAANNQRADVNGDKVINILDLVAVANAFE
ncbi:MAG: leucine-rich repeat domain-containing protein [Candidatus Poribacteria bacterium]|nr:leucine-rich repeat domain-containing protein [Candidatus Poribacteria bacterium]